MRSLQLTLSRLQQAACLLPSSIAPRLKASPALWQPKRPQGQQASVRDPVTVPCPGTGTRDLQRLRPVEVLTKLLLVSIVVL